MQTSPPEPGEGSEDKRAPSQGSPAGEIPAGAVLLNCYLDNLSLIERMHRLLLDVIKDEFERLGVLDINAVQALLLFNIGENEVTAGELKSRGYYQGSNVSYNLKKLVETGYMHHQRCSIDRRSVRVRLTERGLELRKVVADLFERHVDALPLRGVVGHDELDRANATLRRIERFWTEQIRYIY
ncbi:MAG: MarR family transcriptional regulator [Pararhodobacter sp.]|nr:MarR family transcriptional regulator [Pararhodobacter sp.]